MDLGTDSDSVSISLNWDWYWTNERSVTDLAVMCPLGALMQRQRWPAGLATWCCDLGGLMAGCWN